ncbi:MAG: hypothetical protein M1825_002639 [Sarcosagium campestre]|nr:MAG: hypothetical protein M1825_002639 [Sarcosagium campestre]
MTPSTPPPPGADLSLYMETSLSRVVTYKNKPRVLRGIADYALGYAGAGETHAASLVIVESKRTYELDGVLGQLFACMGILHHARKDKDAKYCAVWGAATDGTCFDLWRIGNDYTLGVSGTLEWEFARQKKKIYSTLRAITRAAVISSPTTSPLKGDLYKRFAENFKISGDSIDYQITSDFDKFNEEADVQM